MDLNCIHPAVVRMQTKGKIDGKDFAVYVCINPNCGTALGTAPIVQFENMDAEQAREYLQNIAKTQIKIPKMPSMKPPTHTESGQVKLHKS